MAETDSAGTPTAAGDDANAVKSEPVVVNGSNVDESNAMDTSSGDPRIDDWVKKGFDSKVAAGLIRVFDEAAVAPEELEDRTIEALRSMKADHAVTLLTNFCEANLVGVQNKASHFGMMVKTFKDKVRQFGIESALEASKTPGPDKEKLKAILDRTGYPLEVTIGQRKYGGPPPGWEGPQPGGGTELYIGHLPNNIFEDRLIPLLEEVGEIWDLRIMMDPTTGLNKGYAFCVFKEKEHTTAAAKKYDGHEIDSGRKLKCNVSIANTRLFVGNIPKTKGKEEIIEEFEGIAEGITDVIIYPSAEDPTVRKNRGFCFLQFDDHKSASNAKRKLGSGRAKPWNRDVMVDWAEPQEDPDEETMSKVKVLYVKNLKPDVTEDMIRDTFKEYGEMDRVKRQKDYAFVHFTERDNAIKAMEAVNGHEFCGQACEITLAKPQTEGKKKKSMGQMMNMGSPRGRGRGGMGNFYGGGGPMGFGGGGYGDGYGYGYDSYYGGDYYGDYGGWDGYGYGYEEYDYGYSGGGGYGSPMMRGRGMRGGGVRSPMGMRGGRGGMRGGRGGMAMGRGGMGMRRGMKRKGDDDGGAYDFKRGMM